MTCVGTLDALLCGDRDEADNDAMLREIERLLVPGAAYVCVTSARPSMRLPYLQRGDLWADIQVRC